MKKFEKLMAQIWVCLSLGAVILDSAIAIPAALASVTYAILSLKE